MPSTVSGRFITGLTATVVPRAIAQRLGLIRVEGGRGFWLFAELDTIVFDIALLFAIFYCARQLVRTRGRMNAMFVQVALLLVLIAVPLIYTVSNFGTLFRLRQMIFLGICLLPVALAARTDVPRKEETAAVDEAPARIEDVPETAGM